MSELEFRTTCKGCGTDIGEGDLYQWHMEPHCIWCFKNLVMDR